MNPGYVARQLGPTALRALSTFPAVLVTGPRQSGKTTLLRHLLADSHRFVSLEQPFVRDQAKADPDAFLDLHPPPALLDEIQYVPELLHAIKDRVDSDRRPGLWALTGSQSFALMQGVSQTLAGRVAILDLLPLSVAEATHHHDASIDDVLNAVFEQHAADRPTETAVDATDWLLRGGYPELRLQPGVDRTLWLSSYVQTYLQRDVRELVQVGDLDQFARFVRFVAGRSGNLLNLEELGREAGVTGPTARRWLSVLQASHLALLLPPYHENFGKRLRKGPKLHLLDPGLHTFLLGLHGAEPLRHGPSFGAVLESAVVGEWRKAFVHRGEPAEFFHWRSASGLEVDLVIERNQRLYGVEVKATSAPRPEHAQGLRKWLELAGPRARGVVACLVDRPAPLGGGIWAVPWWVGGGGGPDVS
jgi:predicted AAA+ superfamily ATPase